MEAPESSGPTRLDENLFPVIPPGYPPKGIVTFRNGDTLFNTGARHASMDILAVELSRYLKQPHRRRDGASCEVRFRPILDARFVCFCAYCRRWVGGNRHVPSHPSTGAIETRPQAGKAEISDRRASRGSHGQSPDRELSRVTIGGGIASTKRQHRTRQARERVNGREVTGNFVATCHLVVSRPLLTSDGLSPRSDGVALTGEGKLVRKATGYRKSRSRAIPHRVRGLREPSFGAHWSVSVTHRFLRRGLKQEGVKIDAKRMDEPYGRFAWIYDLDGNKIELWQPLSAKP